MAGCGEPLPFSELLQRSQSCKSRTELIASSPQRFPQQVISSNPRRMPRPLSSPPLPTSCLPLTPLKELNQDQEGLMCRVQGGITKLKERCQSALKSLIYGDVDKNQEETEKVCDCDETENLLTIVEEEENLPLLGNLQDTMEGVQLRPRPLGVHSKEWARRITDYQFLSGKDGEIPRRSTRVSTVAKRKNRRATVMVPQVTSRPSNPGYKCSKCELVTHMNCLNGVQRCEGSTLYPGYGNLQLQQYAWWVEEMTRTTASDRLLHQPQGTFLIRWSDRYQKLVLSLKVENRVKHMRIFKHEETSGFYLSEVRYFHSLDSLVKYYGSNCLSECFSNLFAYLLRPLYEVAISKFSYRGTEKNHLSLELGDRVIVTSHDGENNGWWKGRIDNRVGDFPMEYVRVQNT